MLKGAADESAENIAEYRRHILEVVDDGVGAAAFRRHALKKLSIVVHTISNARQRCAMIVLEKFLGHHDNLSRFGYAIIRHSIGEQENALLDSRNISQQDIASLHQRGAQIGGEFQMNRGDASAKIFLFGQAATHFVENRLRS